MPDAEDQTLRLRSDDLEWREVSEEIIVLDLRANTYLSINASGTHLWSSLVAGSSREAMTESLVSRFGIESDQARRDVDAFVTMLDERGMLA